MVASYKIFQRHALTLSRKNTILPNQRPTTYFRAMNECVATSCRGERGAPGTRRF